MRFKNSSTRGFTLAELLVVLAILAVLTMVAVQSMTPVANQARHDATQRTLKSIADSILSTNQSAITGFVADTGRLPLRVADLTGRIDPVNNVTLMPADLAAYTFQPFQLTTLTSTGNQSLDVRLPTGWNGPYLLPQSGASVTTDDLGQLVQLADGWGNSLPAFVISDLANGSIKISSLGDPNAVGFGDPATGAAVVFTTLPGNAVQASALSVAVVNASGAAANLSGAHFVAVFGPSPATATVSTTYTAGSAIASDTVYQVANGIHMSTTEIPEGTSSVVVEPPLLTDLLVGNEIPLVGGRIVCVMNSNGYVVAGPVSTVLRPGYNDVVLRQVP